MKVERLTGTQDEIMAQAVAVCYGKEPSVERVGRVVRHNSHIAVARFGWASIKLCFAPSWQMLQDNRFLFVKQSSHDSWTYSGNMQTWIHFIEWLKANAFNLYADTFLMGLGRMSKQIFHEYRSEIEYVDFCIVNDEPYPAYRISGVSRACAAQLARHTNIATCTGDDMPLSMLEQSTRYCDYGNAEFIGVTYYDSNGGMDGSSHEAQDTAVSHAQHCYKWLRGNGISKQDARRILPLGTATTLCMAGRVQDWEAFIKLRDDKHAEWEIREVAQAIREDLGL